MIAADELARAEGANDMLDAAAAAGPRPPPLDGHNPLLLFLQSLLPWNYAAVGAGAGGGGGPYEDDFDDDDDDGFEADG